MFPERYLPWFCILWTLPQPVIISAHVLFHDGFAFKNEGARHDVVDERPIMADEENGSCVAIGVGVSALWLPPPQATSNTIAVGRRSSRMILIFTPPYIQPLPNRGCPRWAMRKEVSLLPWDGMPLDMHPGHGV